MLHDVPNLVPGMSEVVESRRRELGLTPSAFAEAAGLTPAGLEPVRKGVRKSYQEVTLLGVGRALRWRHDWYERLLAGIMPVSIDDELPPTLDGRLSRLEERLARIEGLLHPGEGVLG